MNYLKKVRVMMNKVIITNYKLTLLKIILAFMLAICFLKLPYGYYQFLRLSGTISFLYLAYLAKEGLMFKIIWFGSALLLNPILKINLTKYTWNIIDFALALILIISIFIKPGNINSKTLNS